MAVRAVKFFLLLVVLSLTSTGCTSLLAAPNAQDITKTPPFNVQDAGPELVIYNSKGEECLIVDMIDGTVTVLNRDMHTTITSLINGKPTFKQPIRGEYFEFKLAR